MSLYLTHVSALALYDTKTIARPDEDARAVLPDSHIPAFKSDGIRHMLNKVSMPEPLLACAPIDSHRRESHNLHSLVVRDPQLRDEFYQLSGQLYVATPELALLSVAPDMRLVELILLVSELCSRFAIDPKAEHGYLERAPITSKELILQFLNPLKKQPGIKSLRKAVELATEGARSPAEVKFHQRLTLPRHMGGYDICRPAVNGRVSLSVAGLSQLTSREVDFLWEQAHFAAEYDSGERHGEATRSADTIRANEISSAGYNIVSIVPEQIATVTNMNQLVAGMATHIYAHRTPANLKLLHQFILQPDEATYQSRDDLRKELNQIYETEPWRLPLQRRHARIAANHEAKRTRDHKRYLKNKNLREKNPA